MTLKLNFELMADYNQNMNNKIYKAASLLSASELAKNRGAFFDSIIATLNHILVGDIIWLKRFSNHPAQLKTLDYVRNLQSPEALDTILYTELKQLYSARKKIDSTIQHFSHELTEIVLTSTLNYKNTKGEVFNKNMAYLIQHFFNHQTHHRGQASTLFSQAGVDIGVTDLLLDIPDE